MRATQVSEALKALIPTRRPLFLHGAPGIGKSSLVAQACDALGLTLCDVRAVLLDPVDLRGIPTVNGDHRAHWCLPDFLPRDGEGVLLLDELPQAPPLTQSACLQLTLDRRIGEYELPDGWIVIAAGNRQEDRAGAHKLITPLLNRFIHLDLEVSVEDWQAWALNNGVAPDVRSFINFRPSLLFAFDPKDGARAFPTPRSWEFVSQVSSVTPEHLLHAVTAGCVGDGPAAEFIAFRKLYTQLPDPSVVLKNPSSTTVPTDPAVLYALSGALVERARSAKDKELNALGVFASRMPAEYATLLIRDTIAVAPKACSCESINGWVRQNATLFSKN